MRARPEADALLKREALGACLVADSPQVGGLVREHGYRPGGRVALSRLPFERYPVQGPADIRLEIRERPARERDAGGVGARARERVGIVATDSYPATRDRCGFGGESPFRRRSLRLRERRPEVLPVDAQGQHEEDCGDYDPERERPATPPGALPGGCWHEVGLALVVLDLDPSEVGVGLARQPALRRRTASHPSLALQLPPAAGDELGLGSGENGERQPERQHGLEATREQPGDDEHDPACPDGGLRAPTVDHRSSVDAGPCIGSSA
jgi:hypothetical protein